MLQGGVMAWTARHVQVAVDSPKKYTPQESAGLRTATKLRILELLARGWTVRDIADETSTNLRQVRYLDNQAKRLYMESDKR